MRTKAAGLCAKSRRAVDGGVFRVKNSQNFELWRMPELKMLEKRPETERKRQRFHARKALFVRTGTKLDETGLRKGHLGLEKYHFSKLAGCQWIKGLFGGQLT